jgi:hypothetical protein
MPDDGYTILSAAAKRAEENGTEQVEEEGRIVEHHQWKIMQVLLAHRAERGSLLAKIERLQVELAVTEGALTTINGRIADATEHDRRVLAAYIQEAPQYRDNRAGKTFPFAHGRLQLRTNTAPAKATLLDEAAARQLYPDYTEPKLRWSILKKERIGVRDDGTVYDTETGEDLPPEMIAGTAKVSEETAFVEVGGVKFDLYGTIPTPDQEDDTDDDTDADADNPFSAWQ